MGWQRGWPCPGTCSSTGSFQWKVRPRLLWVRQSNGRLQPWCAPHDRSTHPPPTPCYLSHLAPPPAARSAAASGLCGQRWRWAARRARWAAAGRLQRRGRRHARGAHSEGASENGGEADTATNVTPCPVHLYPLPCQCRRPLPGRACCHTWAVAHIECSPPAHCCPPCPLPSPHHCPRPLPLPRPCPGSTHPPAAPRAPPAASARDAGRAAGG